MSTVQRRARPLLGTLVEVGIADGPRCFEAAFEAITAVQSRLSRFDPGSDVSRFHALTVGETLPLSEHGAAVLRAAVWLAAHSEGAFDVTQGRAPEGWRLEGDRLHKLHADVRLDLGGIAKGHAVDCAVQALQEAGCSAGWVNAGGDLRTFGDYLLPVSLRDEHHGGVRPMGSLHDAALATSHFGSATRSTIWSMNPIPQETHISVMAPQCLWADALTKVVAASGNPHHPLLATLDAQAWLH